MSRFNAIVSLPLPMQGQHSGQPASAAQQATVQLCALCSLLVLLQVLNVWGLFSN